MSHKIGTVVRTTGTFRVGSTLTDPTAITCMVKTPAGVETSYVYGSSAVVRSSVGVYYLDVPCTESGKWYLRWKGTGTAAAAEESSFSVDASGFTTP